MNHREIIDVLAKLTEDQCNVLTEAAAHMRSIEESMAHFAPPKKVRKPRAPKSAPVAAPAAAPAAPAKRRGRPPLPKSPGFASALDKLKAVKEGGVKIRRPSDSADESDE